MQRIVAVSDIHGFYDEMITALNEVNFNPETDLFVSCGDAMDRGSKPRQVIEFLNKLPEVMNPGGRIAILTFHSGEDKLVKQAFKHFRNEGQFSYVNDEVIRPSKEECIRNSRAHSTKMRVAIKAST